MSHSLKLFGKTKMKGKERKGIEKKRKNMSEDTKEHAPWYSPKNALEVDAKNQILDIGVWLGKLS